MGSSFLHVSFSVVKELAFESALNMYLSCAAVSFLFLPAHTESFKANTHYISLLWRLVRIN